jgi:hypothetical protein
MYKNTAESQKFNILIEKNSFFFIKNVLFNILFMRQDTILPYFRIKKSLK